MLSIGDRVIHKNDTASPPVVGIVISGLLGHKGEYKISWGELGQWPYPELYLIKVVTVVGNTPFDDFQERVKERMG